MEPQERTMGDNLRSGLNQLAEQIERLIRAGNARHVIITREDRTVAEFSLTIGVIGAIIVPYLAVLAAIVILLTGSSVRIEQVEQVDQEM